MHTDPYCFSCSLFIHLICSWLLMLMYCICRRSPAGYTAPTVTRPTVFPRMEQSSCTRSSAVRWMTLSLCCGRRGLVARVTHCAHTALAIHLSETWKKVWTKPLCYLMLIVYAGPRWSLMILSIPYPGLAWYSLMPDQCICFWTGLRASQGFYWWCTQPHV